MGEFLPPQNIHDDNWHARQMAIGHLQQSFRNGAENGEVLFPCIAGKGPTPLLAGIVESPESPYIDQLTVEAYDLAKDGFPAFGIDVTSKEDEPQDPDFYLLTAKEGTCKSSHTKSVPLGVDDYLGLSELLTHTVYSQKAGLRTVQNLSEAKRLIDFDTYVRKNLMTRRQKMAEIFQRWVRGLDTYGFITGITGLDE